MVFFSFGLPHLPPKDANHSIAGRKYATSSKNSDYEWKKARASSSDLHSRNHLQKRLRILEKRVFSSSHKAVRQVYHHNHPGLASVVPDIFLFDHRMSPVKASPLGAIVCRCRYRCCGNKAKNFFISVTRKRPKKSSVSTRTIHHFGEKKLKIDWCELAEVRIIRRKNHVISLKLNEFLVLKT